MYKEVRGILTMSKLNHERVVFKILKDINNSDNSKPELQSEVSFEFEYPCDGSYESWLTYKHLFQYIVPPTQHAIIYGEFPLFQNNLDNCQRG